MQHLTNQRSFKETLIQLKQKVARRGINYSLDRLNSALSVLQNPHHHLPPTVHIAGTNGKGSVAHSLTQALLQKNHATLTYTSPHIQCYTERFQINGTPISNDVFCDLFSRVSCCDSNDELSEYEMLTLMAFVLAQELSPDVFILETGLGGRLDATNVIPTSMAIITDIGLDHTHILGDTVTDIAREKAGIIKESAHVVTHLDHAYDVLEIIKSKAKSQSATLHWANQKQRFQDRNMALVATALTEFFDIETPQSLLDNVSAPFGRLSPSSYHGTPCWMDVGHNAHAARAILNSHPMISDWIIGMTKEKDMTLVLDCLMDNNQRVKICEYQPHICHHYSMLPDRFQRHASLWSIGDDIEPNSIFFGSFTFIESLLHEAPK